MRGDYLNIRKMKIKPINKFLRKTLEPLFGTFIGVSLCPFGIYVDDWSDQYVINHEKIHWKQQLEMLIIPFYIWYLTELFIRRTFISKHDAYTCLSFEREAYQNQYDIGYLKRRKPYSWVKYLKMKKI